MWLDSLEEEPVLTLGGVGLVAVDVGLSYPCAVCLHPLTSRLMASASPLAQALLAWYDDHLRPLPWREGSDPYAIWVAEVMLQQTQARTVVPYYTRFVRRFPTLESLAAASLDDVLKVWEGLGYYARARNLHRAARRIVERDGGRVPDTLEALVQLPGIGRYTAGAILSIAYGIPAPAVDANARRVLSRLYLLDGDEEDRAIEAQLWDLADGLVPTERPGDFNQALMELGATVCLPRSPKCGRCPLSRRCRARRLGRQEEIPRRGAPRHRPHQDVVAAVILRRGRLLIARRPQRGLLGGLWELPGGPAEPSEGLEEALRRIVRSRLGLRIEVEEPLAPIRHGYTHRRVTLHPFRCRYLGGSRTQQAPRRRWVPRSRLGEYAFPAAYRRVLDRLDIG